MDKLIPLYFDKHYTLTLEEYNKTVKELEARLAANDISNIEKIVIVLLFSQKTQLRVNEIRNE